MNKVSVTTDNELSKKFVKIEHGISVNTISRPNDTWLFDDRDKYNLLFDKRNIHKPINDYGENDFLITYADSVYLSFRQFKFNRRHQHDYKFHFSLQDSVIFVKVDIQGQDKMRFERSMIPIRLADKFLCNTPVDSAGHVYNMIELKNK
jgi:hypothetical protein